MSRRILTQKCTRNTIYIYGAGLGAHHQKTPTIVTRRGGMEEAGEGLDTAHIRRMSKNWPIWARGAPCMVYSLVYGGLSCPWFSLVVLGFPWL